MADHWIDRDWGRIYARTDGADSPVAPTVVFTNALGTTLHLWDRVLPLLPDHLRFVRFDTRGHGRSDVPDSPYAMGAMVSDAAVVCDALRVRDCVLVGLSMGGLVAQGLAVKRLDVVRGLVLSSTAAKIGTPQYWHDRIATVRVGGLEAIADGAMERLLSREFHATGNVAPWRQMLVQTDIEGYCGCCAAIAGTDMMTPTSGLRLPALGLCGAEDPSTPPDLVREAIGLIPGSTFQLIPRAAHFPCVDQPIGFAEALQGFLTRIGHY